MAARSACNTAMANARERLLHRNLMLQYTLGVFFLSRQFSYSPGSAYYKASRQPIGLPQAMRTSQTLPNQVEYPDVISTK
jgi:hypothetical protein